MKPRGMQNPKMVTTEVSLKHLRSPHILLDHIFTG